jgi:hypothetical protein
MNRSQLDATCEEWNGRLATSVWHEVVLGGSGLGFFISVAPPGALRFDRLPRTALRAKWQLFVLALHLQIDSAQRAAHPHAPC